MITKVKTVVYRFKPYQSGDGSDEFDNKVNESIKMLEDQGLNVTDVKYNSYMTYNTVYSDSFIMYTALLVCTR